jgi:predicted ArsR family transcriptional regulator
VDQAWGALELLTDRTRRALYEHVRRARGQGVTREQAAAAIGISRGLAAFHLDKLVDAGLLSATFVAPKPRGRGRTPKVYRTADGEIDLSLPGRRYDLMGEILAAAIDATPRDEPPHAEPPHADAPSNAPAPVPADAPARAHADAPAGVREAALRVAYQRGRDEADAERRSGGRLERLLERLGFEPDQAKDAADAIRLRNCPFQRLAARHTELICGINHAFITGILHGIGATALEAELAPVPGCCCVRLAPAP